MIVLSRKSKWLVARQEELWRFGAEANGSFQVVFRDGLGWWMDSIRRKGGQFAACFGMHPLSMLACDNRSYRMNSQARDRKIGRPEKTRPWPQAIL